MSTEAEFRASLECYRGPVDLLLYLIKKDEVDILDIPIGRITEQFLAYIQILSSLDPNACGEFLVVAARLMEIKSRELLPVDIPDDDEEDLEDPRLELVLQLLEYKKYKERALLLEHMVSEHKHRHRRPETELDDLADEPAVPLEIGEVSMWDLVTAFQKVQLAFNMRQPHRVLYEDRPIEDYLIAIETRLDRLVETGGQDSSLAFESLFDDCRDRYDAIGYFLAVLELAKQGSIFFTQEELFGPIAIRRRVSEPEPEPEDEDVAPATPEEPEETDSGTKSPSVEMEAETSSESGQAGEHGAKSEPRPEDKSVAENESTEDSLEHSAPGPEPEVDSPSAFDADPDADADTDTDPKSEISPPGAHRISGFLSDSSSPTDPFPPTSTS